MQREDAAVAFTDFIFQDIEDKIDGFKDRPWIVDIPSKKSVSYGQVQGDAIKIASALARLGFKHGDVLYFVTFEVAHLFMVKVAVWMLGGAVRGCSQQELPEQKYKSDHAYANVLTADLYAQQIKESDARFVLIDSETIHAVQPALEILQYNGCILNLGDELVQGATHISELLKDDGSAFKPQANLNPKEDALMILNTSGSTGHPKGVVHTHYSSVSMLLAMRDFQLEDTLLLFMINYGIGLFLFAMYFLKTGRTLYCINKFDDTNYFDHLKALQPRSIILYPRFANWFARCDKLLEQIYEANFLKKILVGGWVLDQTTVDLLSERLPNTHLHQIYGMTEFGFCTSTKGKKPTKLEAEGEAITSSGTFLHGYKGKILELDDRKRVGSYETGELCVRSPSIAKGYLISGGKVEKLTDEEGWFKTGDVVVLDKKGNLFIKERVKFMYKYLDKFVLPSEIETVLLEHPSIQEAAVVGMPDPNTNSASRALVVIKKGEKCSEEEVLKFVAGRLPHWKHLHGGARFVGNLPMNKGGKLDRKELMQLALKNN